MLSVSVAWCSEKNAAFSLDYVGTGGGGSAHAHGKKRLLEINALIENAPSGEALVARTAFERREEKLDKEEKKDERKEAVQRYAEDYEEAAMAR